MIRLSDKIKAHPSKVQAAWLYRICGHVRYVYNYILDLNAELYPLAKNNVIPWYNDKDLDKALTKKKSEAGMEWLFEAPAI